jgi:hypothetical protein
MTEMARGNSRDGFIAATRSHKRLDPEIKALRAINRAMDALPDGSRQRALEWLVASRCGLPGIRLPKVVKP